MVRFYLEKVISQFTPVYGLYLSQLMLIVFIFLSSINHSSTKDCDLTQLITCFQ